MQRSEERRRHAADRLRACAIAAFVTRVSNVVRRNIENLIKLSQCFWETTKSDIGNRVLGEQIDVARVEPLGFVEVRLAPVPLASPPRDIGQRFRNPAAIRQKLTCLLKVTHCGVVILQAGVVVRSLSQYGLAEIRLKSERGFGCLPCLFTQRGRWLKNLCEVAARIDDMTAAPN